jgi:hypothetical protein
LLDRGVNGNIILKRIIKKYDVGRGVDISGSGKGQVAGFCRHGNVI